MSVELNHLIMPSKDRVASAEFLSGVLGLKPPTAFAHFMCVEVGNGVTLDYDDRDNFVPGHFAFLVDRRGVRRDLRPRHRLGRHLLGRSHARARG